MFFYQTIRALKRAVLNTLLSCSGELQMNEENKRCAPRLRTIPQAYEEIKKYDPDTAFTIRALRRMVNTGELPTVAINSKRLINIDLLYDLFSFYNEPVSCVSKP